jgi:phosphopantetheinyl transferase
MEIYVITKLNSIWKNNSSKEILIRLSEMKQWDKPQYLETGKPTISNAYISVTHSNDILIIAYANQEIGIDCEKIRPIQDTLINKLQLDPNNPILDWCKRESIIKLLDDKQYLLKKELNDYFFTEITLNSSYCVVVSSKALINNYSVIHLNENLDIIEPIQ